MLQSVDRLTVYMQSHKAIKKSFSVFIFNFIKKDFERLYYKTCNGVLESFNNLELNSNLRSGEIIVEIQNALLTLWVK